MPIFFNLISLRGLSLYEERLCVDHGMAGFDNGKKDEKGCEQGAEQYLVMPLLSETEFADCMGHLSEHRVLALDQRDLPSPTEPSSRQPCMRLKSITAALAVAQAPLISCSFYIS